MTGGAPPFEPMDARGAKPVIGACCYCQVDGKVSNGLLLRPNDWAGGTLLPIIIELVLFEAYYY